MRPGELNQRITIERKTRTPDGGGGYTETWTETAEVWALVRPMSGQERSHAQQAQTRANYLIVVRSGLDVLETDRIVWQGYRLNIRFIKRRGPRPLYLEIEAEMGAES